MFQWCQQPLVGQSLIIEASRSHSATVNPAGLLWTTQRLPDITQHSQEADIHAKGAIATLNPSMRAVAHPRLRPRGHWDQPTVLLGPI